MSLECHGCGWQPIAPDRNAALNQLAEHIVSEHSREIDDEIPDGALMISDDGGETWYEFSYEDLHNESE